MKIRKCKKENKERCKERIEKNRKMIKRGKSSII